MRISDAQFDAYLANLKAEPVRPRRRQRLLAGLTVAQVARDNEVHENTIFTFEANLMDAVDAVTRKSQNLVRYYDRLTPDPTVNSPKLIRKLAGFNSLHTLGRVVRVALKAFDSLENGTSHPEPARGRALRTYQRLAELVDYPFPFPVPRVTYPQTFDTSEATALSRVHLRKAVTNLPAPEPVPQLSVSTSPLYESWVAHFIHGIVNSYMDQLNLPGLAGLWVYYDSSTHQLHATGFTPDNVIVTFALPTPPEYVPRSLFTLRNYSRAYPNPVPQ